MNSLLSLRTEENFSQGRFYSLGRIKRFGSHDPDDRSDGVPDQNENITMGIGPRQPLFTCAPFLYHQQKSYFPSNPQRGYPEDLTIEVSRKYRDAFRQSVQGRS